jgi:hypothetical protein
MLNDGLKQKSYRIKKKKVAMKAPKNGTMGAVMAVK